MAGPDYSKIANDQHIDETFAKYRSNPESVSPDWRAFFQGFELERGRAAASGDVEVDAVPQAAHSLVTVYRRMGHLVAHLAPISYKRPPHPLLEISEYGFTDADLDTVVGNGGFLGQADGTLGDLLAKLQDTYFATSQGKEGDDGHFMDTFEQNKKSRPEDDSLCMNKTGS